MATTPDDILINAVMQAESRGKRFDKAGKLLTSVKGAEGEMQVMPTTQTKPGFGVTPARDSSAEEKARVGRDYLKAMISKYGDTTTALAAYNWGPGKVNKWLEKGGDFNKLPEETKKYIKTIQASLPKGTQLASAPPVKVNPPAKASTNRVAPAAPATPPVSITKEMVADLGPNYQAALAAMALGDTREDDDDEESIAERYAAKQEKLAEEAASVPPPRIAGMELTYQSPFPEEQIAQAPEGLAHGGVPRRGNSARDALRMMKEAQEEQEEQEEQPVKRAGGSPETGEYYQDPMGMDTGPITADTTKALQLRQGLSAKEALGTLKGIAKEGVSNAESALRGSGAAMPGMAGDVEAIFRDEKKRKFKTTDEILKTEMPKRMTMPTKEAAGFEEVGTYIDPTTGLPFAKGAAKAALAGLKSSGPQVEKALMKMAPGAEPSYIIPREASAGATLKNVDSLVNDYKIGVDNILPAYAPNRGPLLSMLDKKASDYFYNVYGSKNDPIRQAILDGKLPAYLLKDIKEYAKDPTVLNAARKGDKKALTKFDAIYDQLTGLTKAGERAGQPVYDLYGSTASRLPFFSRNVLIESLSTIPFNRLDKMTFPEAVIEGTNNYVKKIYGTEKKNLTFMPETSLK